MLSESSLLARSHSDTQLLRRPPTPPPLASLVRLVALAVCRRARRALYAMYTHRPSTSLHTHIIHAYSVSFVTKFKTSGTTDFPHNFCECRPIFKISSLKNSRGNSLCYYDGGLHLTELHCYTALHILKIKYNCISKMTPSSFHHFFLKY